MIRGSDFNKYFNVYCHTPINKHAKDSTCLFKEDIVMMSAEEFKSFFPRFEPSKILSPSDIIKIKEMHLNGLSLRKIAKQFNVSHQTIKRALNKANE